MYLMHIKKGDELLFSFRHAVELQCISSFLDPLPCSIAQQRDSICSFVLLRPCPTSYRRHRSPITLFYGRLSAHKRNATNATDHLSGKGKRRRKNTSAVGRHDSQKKKGGQGANGERGGGEVRTRGAEGRPRRSRREILITTRSVQWL